MVFKWRYSELTVFGKGRHFGKKEIALEHDDKIFWNYLTENIHHDQHNK